MIYSITGCGGVGKDTILNKVLEEIFNLNVIVSTTSRPMRQGEINGISYNFVSKQEALQMLNDEEFIEHRTYNVITDKGNDTWIYGITKNSIDINSNKDYIVIVDYCGLKELKKYLKDNNSKNKLISFYIDANKQNRLLRYLQRENMTDDKVEEAIRRFKDDNEKVLPAKSYCNYVINNDNDLYEAVNNIITIMIKNGSELKC